MKGLWKRDNLRVETRGGNQNLTPKVDHLTEEVRGRERGVGAKFVHRIGCLILSRYLARLDSLNTQLSPGRCWRRPRSQEMREEGRGTASGT